MSGKKRKKPSRNPAGNRVPASQYREGTAVWIKTEPTLDGLSWMVTVEIDEDNAIVLTRESANEYAYAILETVARAEYDAAVLTQISTKMDKDAGIMVVVGLRNDRPDIDYSVMAPMSFSYGVTEKGKPFITILIKDITVGQWEIPDAREHALMILEAIVVADLDGGYLRTLRGVIGLDEHTARNVVDDLKDWREGL